VLDGEFVCHLLLPVGPLVGLAGPSQQVPSASSWVFQGAFQETQVGNSSLWLVFAAGPLQDGEVGARVGSVNFI